jgi:long-subunit fatty acid transport protein
MRQLISLLVVLLFSANAWGAAFYLGEIGTKSQSRGGANIVNPEDPTAMWLNPAALSNSKGFQLRMDNTLVFLNSSFVRNCGGSDNCGPAPGVVRNYANGRFAVEDERSPEGEFIAPPVVGGLGKLNTDSKFDGERAATNQAGPQYIPNLWASWGDAFGVKGFAVGAAAYAPYAGDYAFGEEDFTRYTLVDRDLLELFYQATVSYSFDEMFAVGVSLQGVSAGVKQRVAMSADRFGNENPDADLYVDLDTVTHFIPSANAGIWANPWKGLEIGASVQLPRSVSASGPLALDTDNIGPEVQALIDGGILDIVGTEGTATARFELPPFYRVGAKYGNDDAFGDGFLGYDLELDFVYEQWSTYDHIALISEGIEFSLAGADPEPLDPIIQPKDWQDSWSVRLGGEVSLFEEMLFLRAGGFYETSAIPTETLAVDLLNGEKIGVGAGVGCRWNGLQLDLGYSNMIIFDRTVGDESLVYVDVPVGGFNDEPRTRVAMGDYSMSYHVVQAALTVQFDELFGSGRKKGDAS